MNEQDRAELMRNVALGMDAEAFIGSDLGRYLVSRAQDEAVDAMQALKTMVRSDYTETNQFLAAITEQQNIVSRAESLETWIVECVENGKNTEQMLQEEEATD